MNTFAVYRCNGGVDSTQPRFKTSNLRFVMVPNLTIVANGSGQTTDKALSTPNIWKRDTNWLHTMESNATLSLLLARLSRSTKQ